MNVSLHRHAKHNNSDLAAIIATNKFSLGAKPGDINFAKHAPKEWLESQLTPSSFKNITAKNHATINDTSSTSAIRQFRQYRSLKNTLSQKERNKPLADTDESQQELKKIKPRTRLSQWVNYSLNASINTNHGLSWRLLAFFSNHFSVSSQGALMTFLCPTLETEAIAPHLFGHYEDMLIAVTSHPAMLIYLNNEKSFGEHSVLGLKKPEKGLNENLARELLELHTLGVDGPYSQRDIIELANAISGWSVNTNQKRGRDLGFVYRSQGHEPGTRRILTKTYAQHGQAQGESVLRDLSRHHSTAQHICFKLARHFSNDVPEHSLVERLTKRWLSTNGNLKDVYLTLIHSPELWLSSSSKYKTPREFVISSCRACRYHHWKNNAAINLLQQLGQRPFNAGSPAGFGDTFMAWGGAKALQNRIDWAAQFSRKIKIDPHDLIQHAFDNQVSPQTLKVIQQAESRIQARALFLMSPEFLRR